MIRLTPDPGYSGPDSFTYEVCDNGTPVICDQATVTVTVNSINDGPTANDDVATTDEDTPVVIDVVGNDTDSDGTIDATSVNVLSGPTNGSVTIDPITGDVTYTPDPGYSGPDSFTYEVCDNGTPVICDQATVTVTVTVNSINDGPTANDDVATTDEDTPVVIDVVGNDTDSDGTIDATSVNVLTGPTNGSVTVDP
ncbi:MAG: Ig-like domain-containing protein, partial [Cryomorphaceae bacterium]|nr:Ig-like domain-containing protein [Cryomorphaceae bacterium]